MAEENTITTIFRADISQFSASTQQLNQYVRNVNSQFEAATAGMGRWSDNTDGLQAKIQQLNGTLEADKKKLADLSAQYQKMADEGKGNTYQAKQLQIAINKQIATIKKTEKQTEDYTAALKELEDAGVKTKQELKELTDAQEKQGKSADGIAGKLAKGLGAGIAAVGATAVGAVGGFLSLAEGTREYRQGLNQLETAFGRVGFSAEETYEAFNYFGSVLGDTRKAQETMLVLGQLVDTEKELESWTDTLTGVYATYGEAIPLESMSEALVLASKQAVAEGGLADALEWGGVNLEDFNAKLASLNSDEERSAYIQETLNGLYGEAAENYKELNKDVLDASTAQTNLEHAMAKLGAVAEPIMTMLKNSFAGFLSALEPAVKLMGEGLKEAFEGSADGAKKFAEGLTGIVDTFVGKLNEMLPQAVELFLQLIPTLIQSLLNSVPTLITTFSQIISQVLVALGEMIPQIVQSVIAAIPLVIQALLDATPLLLNGAIAFFSAIVQALPQIVEQVLTMIPTVVNQIVGSLESLIPVLLTGAIALFMAIVDAIPTIIDKLIPQIPKIVNTIINGLLKMLPQLLDGALRLLEAIIKAIPLLINKLVPQIPKIVRSIVTALTSRIGDIINGALQLFFGIIDAIPLIIKELIPEIPQIVTSICGALIDCIPELFKVGEDLIKGVWDGILSMGDWLWGKVIDFFGGITDKIKGFFGIESPSKLFKNEIGANLALGIGEGFSEEMSDVEKSMQRSMAKITPSLHIETPNVAPISGNGNWIEQLSDLISRKTSKEVVNNYNFDYKFEKVQTSKLALHKAELATRRIVGGKAWS